jgi:hypothetical protein
VYGVQRHCCFGEAEASVSVDCASSDGGRELSKSGDDRPAAGFKAHPDPLGPALIAEAFTALLVPIA